MEKEEKDYVEASRLVLGHADIVWMVVLMDRSQSEVSRF